ncbi:MAG: acyltransferase family protein [Ornithinimicrobium sp.]
MGSHIRWSERPSASIPHLTGLDGLRAIAVLGVVVYHLDPAWLPGGFLGVDVFFVLSGFLITTLVLQEIEASGRLDFKAFYIRRARRLLPALWLVLASVTIVAVLFVPEELAELRGDVPAAFFYLSNWWYVVADASYFEFVGRPALLQHLWSLAIEEQFYLLWPVVALFAMRGGRTRVRAIAVVGAVVSTAWMAWVAVSSGMPVPNDPSRAYYGTDTHAMGFFVGAAVATVWTPWRQWPTGHSWLSRGWGPSRFRVIAVDLVGVACLAGVLWAFWTVGEFSTGLYRGGFLVIAVTTAGLVASLTHPLGLLGRALARQPLRYLGERSYGIYLWHWPVLMLSRPGFELGFGGPASVALRVLIVLLLAEASYRWVEIPIRRGAIGRWLDGLRSAGWPAFGRSMAGVLVTVAAAAVLTVALYRVPVPAQADELEVEVPVVSAQPDAAAQTSKPSPGKPTPTSSASSPTSGGKEVSPRMQGTVAYGDSVMLGAATALEDAGVRVDAEKSRFFENVVEQVAADRDAGLLGDTVIVHAGNNGPIVEADLDRLVEVTEGHDLVLLTLHVPRSWQDYNNDLLAQIANDHPGITLLDWHQLANDNPGWLYDDSIHLVTSAIADGYVDWMVRELA